VYVQPKAIENADGTYTLYALFTDKNGHVSKEFGGAVELRYILDGERLDKVSATYSVVRQDGTHKLLAPLTIPRPSDGPHWISIRLISGATSLMSVEGQVFTVGRTDNPPACLIPSFGGAVLSGRYRKSLPDFIKWDGGLKRTPPKGRKRSVQFPLGFTEAGLDPLLGRNLSSWWAEPLNEHPTVLYTTQPDIFRDRNGWPIAKNWSWHAEHNATAATVSTSRRPEYNGDRQANTISAYSMGDFDDDKGLWLVSLGGTLTYTDLETGEKIPVAGRVYREDTLPLDFSDDRITQAEINAANCEYIGDAADPDWLKWDGPHTVMACPWNPKFEAVLCDSFKHRYIHVDRSVTPAKVTKICGTTKGREAGPVETAKINRPYAHAIFPDRRIVFCCTPKAGEENDGAVFELSSDWKTLREVAGPDKVQRPFWLCEFEPGYVLVWEHSTSAIKKIHVETGETTFWAKGSALPDGWGVLACDTTGAHGPQYDVFLAPAQSDDNTKIWRFDRAGKFVNWWMKTSAGAASQGPAPYVFDTPAHYPWLMILHRKYAIAMAQGWGELAPHFFRRKLSTDPAVVYDHNAFGAGKGMFDQGTLTGFPYTLRPSGNALRSMAGHSFISSVPGVAELCDTMTDEELADYWRKGAGGFIPRPEFQGKAVEKLVYFLRWCADDLKAGLKPPPNSKGTPAKITAWSAARNADGSVTVILTTDKPTWGCLCDLRDAVPADDYRTAHTLTLDDCGPSVVVRLADLDGIQIQTAAVQV
jgi:hypothetical protein